MFLYPEPVERVAGIAERCQPRPLVMYDMAHVLGLYGAFQEPFKEGADVVTGSTHKTFFGPQRGVVAGNLGPDHPWEDLWGDLVNRAFPGSTSNHHLGTLVELLLAAIEMNHFRDDYQRQVRNNRDKPAKEEVAAYRQGFLEMQYCLPPAEAAPLGARLLASIFPRSDYGKLFAEDIMRTFT